MTPAEVVIVEDVVRQVEYQLERTIGIMLSHRDRDTDEFCHALMALRLGKTWLSLAAGRQRQRIADRDSLDQCTEQAFVGPDCRADKTASRYDDLDAPTADDPDVRIQ